MKKYLLDTHALLWFLEGNERLSSKVNQLLLYQPQDYFLSVASLWEITIKVSLNKLQMKHSLTELEKLLFQNGVSLLPINFLHLKELVQLPFHHKAPFDRLIISQAKTENLTIVSIDGFFSDYEDVTIFW
jgi:PIN domain nuclease of toxin-antitoxin system